MSARARLARSSFVLGAALGGSLSVASLAASCSSGSEACDAANCAATTSGTTTSEGTSSGTTTSDTGGAGGGGGSGGAGGAGAWHVPACANVTGFPGVTFTSDEGATLAPAPLLSGIVYTFGLAALDTPNTLLAEHGGQIRRSSDAGCAWASVGPVTDSPLHLSAGAGGVADGWTDNGNGLFRIAGDVITTLVAPTGSILGLAADPSDGTHLRLGDGDGQLWQSLDSGDHWQTIGVAAAPGNGLGYRIAFDPRDLDHVLFGLAVDGAYLTRNGGGSWAPVTGLVTTGTGANGFSVAVSPVDSDVVWLEGLELGPDARHVYRSTDGGASFAPVVDHSVDVTLYNGNLLVPHPSDPDVLYFVFGTYFQGYGTDIYRYDAVTSQVTKTHNGYDDVSAIVASPAAPSVLYLGLTSEQIN